MTGKKAEEEAPAEDPPVVEDPPIVRDLKALDDRYLAMEREYEREAERLRRDISARQAQFLRERSQVLFDLKDVPAEDAKLGTPALKGFWLMAMKHHPAFEDQIEEWDIPILLHLKDVTKEDLDPEDSQTGFKLVFHFTPNDYFSNETLWKEYHTKEGSPYTGEIETTEIKVCEIEWYDGKNVTVEMVKSQKKIKGGGAKKTKAKAKEVEEPRDSFFRGFFRYLKPGMPIPEDVNFSEARQLCDDSDDDNEDELVALLIENDYESGCAVRDQLVPFAVRWYTGEACPEMGDSDSDDEDDEDSEEESDDDDDDDDDDDSPPAAKKKTAPKKKSGGAGKDEGDKPKEECKQQ